MVLQLLGRSIGQLHRNRAEHDLVGLDPSGAGPWRSSPSVTVLGPSLLHQQIAINGSRPGALALVSHQHLANRLGPCLPKTFSAFGCGA